MKKLLGILAISALAASAFAQGTVVLANQTGLVRQWTSTSDTTLISVPKNGGYVQIIAAKSGSTLANNLFAVGATGYTPNYSSLAGFLAANPGWSAAANDTGTVPGAIALAAGIFSAGTFTISGISAGASASYLLLGWTGAYTTFDAALAAKTFMGQSAIGTTTTGDPTSTPAGIAVSLKTTFAGMTLTPAVVPEPASIALAGLGLAALLVFRRRN